MFAIAIVLAVAPWLSGSTPGPTPGPPRAVQEAGFRLSFETLPDGTMPPEWKLDGWGYEEGYRADISVEGAHRGSYCLDLNYTGELEPTGEGRLFLQTDAAPYRGKRIALRAAMRADAGSSGRLFVRGETGAARSVLVAGTTARPVDETEWRLLEVTGEVPRDAKTIEIAVTHRGRGSVRVDDLELAVLGEIPETDVLPPAKLDDRAVLNLAALARLVGYLRYFHPSDQAAAADWGALVRSAVLAIEGVDGSTELGEILQRHFAGVAPTLRLFVKKQRPEKPSDWLDEPEGDGYSVVRWVHTGLGGEHAPEEFRSERERVPYEGRVPRGFSRPHKPKDFDLGGALMARLPTALYADADGTLPHDDAIAAMGLDPVVAPAVFTGNDRATRTAAALLCWSTLQHFAPLLDESSGSRRAWDAALDDAIRGAGEARNELEFLETLRRLVAELHDGQARVDHKSDWRETHIPVSWALIGDELVVTNAAKIGDSAIGVGVGDVVLKVGRASAEDALLEATRSFSGATPQVRRARALESMLRRHRHTTIDLLLKSTKGGRIPIKYKDSFARARVVEKRPEPYAELRPGIRYVDLSRVRGAHLDELLSKLGSARGVVFDLRGGLRGLDRAELVAHLIGRPVADIEVRVPVSTRPDREKPEWHELVREIEPREPRLGAKLAFLSDGGLVGEAEALLALVRDHGLGAIVGEQTGGTIGLVNATSLPGDYRVEWTATVCEPPRGDRVYGTGVRPDAPVVRDLGGVRAGKDRSLQRAIEVLDGPD